ncbi:MAG: hypothetical protein WC787_04645 [Patescibacteria group bacterium]
MKSRSFMILSAAVAAPTLALGLAMTPVMAAEQTTAARPTLTAEQRATFDQVRALHEAGKNDEAKALIESSGLFKDMPKFGMMHGKGKGMFKHGDKAHGDKANFVRPELTAEQKNIMEQANVLHEAGKNDEAKALIESSGLFPNMHSFGMMHGKGMKGRQ